MQHRKCEHAKRCGRNHTILRLIYSLLILGYDAPNPTNPLVPVSDLIWFENGVHNKLRSAILRCFNRTYMKNWYSCGAKTFILKVNRVTPIHKNSFAPLPWVWHLDQAHFCLTWFPINLFFPYSWTLPHLDGSTWIGFKEAYFFSYVYPLFIYLCLGFWSYTDFIR